MVFVALLGATVACDPATDVRSAVDLAAPERLTVTLGRDAFAAAVAAALRELNQPDRLAANPLTGSALGPDVRDAVLHGIARLADEPRGELLRRVLDRTYVRPSPSQEAAAQVLDLPFSTYRRHLARATARMVELLWNVEVGSSNEHGLSSV